jgi:hypothetical protein
MEASHPLFPAYHAIRDATIGALNYSNSIIHRSNKNFHY